MMSGCPGGPGDANANWVTTSWPPETQKILRYQWEEVLIPYWRELVAYAQGRGVTKLCLELHGHQNVYSASTFFRLRDAVGETSESTSTRAISSGWEPIRSPRSPRW